MKVWGKILAGWCVLLFASCLSIPFMSTDEQLEGKSVSLADSLVVEVKSFKAGLSSVDDGRKTFSPMDKSKVMTRVTVSINNSGGDDYKYGELTRLEMAFWSKGDIHFIQRALVLDPDSSTGTKMFGKNTVTNETLYFVHDKDWVPVAMTVDRLERVLLVDEAHADYAAITANLDKYVNIETMMGMAKEAPFEEIDTFRVSNGIDINDTDHNGHTLLYAAIRFQNDAVLQGAIENGADIHKEISYGYNTPIEPVDFAVLSNNRNAVMALIKAGAHLNREQKNTGRDTLPVIAVRSGNVPALKLITEFSDIDLTGLMIPMSWSPAIPALKFARDRKMTEMVQYLESLTTGSIAQ